MWAEIVGGAAQRCKPNTCVQTSWIDGVIVSCTWHGGRGSVYYCDMTHISGWCNPDFSIRGHPHVHRLL